MSGAKPVLGEVTAGNSVTVRARKGMSPSAKAAAASGLCAGCRLAPQFKLAVFKRNALLMTLTEDSAIAAAAMIGDSRMPRKG